MKKKIAIPPVDTKEIHRNLEAQAKREVPRMAPFFIENWTPGLRALSIQTEIFRLDKDSAICLNAIINATHDAPHDPWSVDGAADLARKLGDMIRIVGGAGFVRLGSRSPKDNPVQMDEFCRPIPARSGRQAVEYLSYSERVYLDLMDARYAGYESTVCVRRWIKVDWDQEFRCFIEDGKIVGITQYYLADGASSWIRLNKKTIDITLRRYLQDAVLPMSGLSSLTVDVILSRDIRPTVLEINPPVSWGTTFPGLFSGGQFNGEFRFEGKVGDE